LGQYVSAALNIEIINEKNIFLFIYLRWDFTTSDSFVFDYFVPIFKILNPEYEHEFKNDLGFGLFFRNAIFQRINKFGQPE